MYWGFPLDFQLNFCSMSRALRLATCAVLGAVMIPAMPEVTAGDMGYQQGTGDCPATVVVAARGNASKDMYTSTRYSTQSDFSSNGREGQTIRSFLQYAEARHMAVNGGDSLLKDTYVLGLTEDDYPAEITVPAVEEMGDIISLLPELGGLSSSVVGSLKENLDIGIPGARTAVEDYEATTGCTPQYILIGYSLGATILMQQESWLAEKGQLAGALYMGTVHQSPGDPDVIGAVHSPGGILGWSPWNSRVTAGTSNRILYCLPDDIACDPTPAALHRVWQETDDSPHTQYFLNPDTEAHSDEVADRFSSWLSTDQP